MPKWTSEAGRCNESPNTPPAHEWCLLEVNERTAEINGRTAIFYCKWCLEITTKGLLK